MSRRAAEMRRVRSSWERFGRRVSLESGGVRDGRVDWKNIAGRSGREARLSVVNGKMRVLRKEVTDLVR